MISSETSFVEGHVRFWTAPFVWSRRRKTILFVVRQRKGNDVVYRTCHFMNITSTVHLLNFQCYFKCYFVESATSGDNSVYHLKRLKHNFKWPSIWHVWFTTGQRMIKHDLDIQFLGIILIMNELWISVAYIGEQFSELNTFNIEQLYLSRYWSDKGLKLLFRDFCFLSLDNFKN